MHWVQKFHFLAWVNETLCSWCHQVTHLNTLVNVVDTSTCGYIQEYCWLWMGSLRAGIPWYMWSCLRRQIHSQSKSTCKSRKHWKWFRSQPWTLEWEDYHSVSTSWPEPNLLENRLYSSKRRNSDGQRHCRNSKRHYKQELTLQNNDTCLKQLQYGYIKLQNGWFFIW